MKFSETEYVDASQQKKIKQKNHIFFGFFDQKHSKLIKNEKKLSKFKPFDNLLCTLFQNVDLIDL